MKTTRTMRTTRTRRTTGTTRTRRKSRGRSRSRNLAGAGAENFQKWAAPAILAYAGKVDTGQ